jgi:hypothetical protein
VTREQLLIVRRLIRDTPVDLKDYCWVFTQVLFRELFTIELNDCWWLAHQDCVRIPRDQRREYDIVYFRHMPNAKRHVGMLEAGDGVIHYAQPMPGDTAGAGALRTDMKPMLPFLFACWRHKRLVR